MTRDTQQLGILDDLKKSLEESAKESGLQNMKSDLHTEEEDNKGKENLEDQTSTETTAETTESDKGIQEKEKDNKDDTQSDDKSKINDKIDEKPLDERVEAIISAEPPGGGHASAKTVASWKEATKTISELKEVKSQLAQELENAKKEIETVKASKEVPANIKEELEYLRAKVAEVDYAALPEVKEQFDKPLSKAQEQIISLFEKAEKEGRPQSAGITEKLKATIAEYGLFGLDWDGLLSACGKPAKEGDKTVLTLAERKAIETTLGTALALQQRKEEAIKEAKGTIAEKLQQQKAQEEQETNKRREEAKGYTTQLDKAIKATVASNPNLQEPKDPGVKATPEQKALYAEQVKAYDEKKTVFNKYAAALLRSKGLTIAGMDQIPDLAPQEFFDIFAGYINNQVAAKEIETLNAKVKELETKLDSFKKGGSTTPQKSTASTPAQVTTANVPNTPAEAREALRKSAQAIFGE